MPYVISAQPAARGASPRAARLALMLAFLGLILPPRALHADPVDRYVTQKMRDLHIPGLALAVLRQGHVVKEQAYGFANLELRVPVTLDTSFSWASTTKIVTGIAIMQLVAQGKIALDAPLAATVPGLPASWGKVTARQCLAHTTGLPYATEDDINATVIEGDRAKLIARLATAKVAPPGTQVDYNTTDYMLLTMLIEHVTGGAYEDYVQRAVLAPAGLRTAAFGDGWAVIPGRADLYTAYDITSDHKKLLVQDGDPVPRKAGILHYGHKIWPDYMQSAAGLNGSIKDIVALEAALRANRLISPAALAEMERPTKMADGSAGPFGLGFVRLPIGGPDTVSYGGGAAVWRIKMTRPDVTVIVLTNLQGARPEYFIADIAALYGPK